MVVVSATELASVYPRQPLVGPLPEKTPLNARITGVVDKGDYRIEKVVYESQPGLHVTAACPAGFILEYSLGANPLLHELALESFDVQAGAIAVPGHVKLKSVDLTVSLESLSFYLAHGASFVERAIALALAGVLAETVGAMARLNELSLEWLTARSQFGRPLWSNQVLQHRAVDMFIALEESRSMLNLAVYACDRMCGSERRAALHAAKAHVAGAARFVGQQAVHLHGAMGLTEELSVGPAYRRIEALQAVLGGADYHTAAYAKLSPDGV